ncbi:MAG: ABC transporter permease [Pseudomonadota bacterium]
MAFAIVRQRLMLLGVVLLGLTMVTFVISRLIPTDPARLIAGDYASEEVVEGIRVELGLNDPIPVQYGRYIGDVAQGDLGISIRTGRPVLRDLAAYFPATLELTLAAMLIAITFGIALGVLSAIYKDGWVDQFVRLFALVGFSTPSFWLALLLIYLFYGQLGLLPAGGRIDPLLDDFSHPTGLLLIDSLLALRLDAFVSAAAHLILPAMSLAFIMIGGFARLVRASVLEELRRDYVRTARSFGLTERRVVVRHVLPNALNPFVTQLGVYFGAMLTGAVVVESMYAWPGLGSYILQAIESLDFPAIMGFTLMTGFIYVLINLSVDLLYLAINPELRGART